MTITMCATTASAICLRYGGKYISSCPDRDSSTGWRPRGESAPAKTKTGTGGGREEERGEQRSALLPLLQYTHPPTHTYFLSVQILFPRDVPAFLWDSPGMKIPGPNSEALRSFPFGLLRCPFLVCVCVCAEQEGGSRRFDDSSQRHRHRPLGATDGTTFGRRTYVASSGANYGARTNCTIYGATYGNRTYGVT